MELFATEVHMLERGRVVRTVGSEDVGALLPGRSIALSIEVDLPRLLVSELADDPAVAGIVWDQTARSNPRFRCMKTISTRWHARWRAAAVAAGAEVRSITPALPGSTRCAPPPRGWPEPPTKRPRSSPESTGSRAVRRLPRAPAHREGGRVSSVAVAAGFHAGLRRAWQRRAR